MIPSLLRRIMNDLDLRCNRSIPGQRLSKTNAMFIVRLKNNWSENFNILCMDRMLWTQKPCNIVSQMNKRLLFYCFHSIAKDVCGQLWNKININFRTFICIKQMPFNYQLDLRFYWCCVSSLDISILKSNVVSYTRSHPITNLSWPNTLSRRRSVLRSVASLFIEPK